MKPKKWMWLLLTALSLFFLAHSLSVGAMPTIKYSPTAQILPNSSEQIAFVSTRDGNSEIYLINADGTGLMNLTNDPAKDYNPAWSPDGRQLVFISNRSGADNLFLLDINSKSVEPLTFLENRVANPVWSPNDERIAFAIHSQKTVGGVDTPYLDIYWINSAGGEPQNVYSRQGGIGGGRITWSHDSEQLLFDTDPSEQLYITDLNGNGGRYIVTSDVWDSPIGSWGDTTPVWSPNGQRVIFHSTRFQGQNDIYVVNTATGDLQNLGIGMVTSFGPVWAPDSQWVAFMSDGLYIRRSETEDPIKLSELSHLGVEAEWSWSPDGKHIAFASREDSDFDIFIAVTDGSGYINLIDDGDNSSEDRDPVWRPKPPSQDGLIAYIGSDGNVRLIEADGSNPRQVTFDSEPGNITYTEPQWSPDGRKLAFVSIHDPNIYTIHIVNVTDNEIEMSFSKSFDQHVGSISWSPDSLWLAYVNQTDIWKMDVTDQDVQRITNTPDLRETDIDWSPDAQELVYIAYETQILQISNSTVEQFKPYIYSIRADGSKTVKLTDDNGVYRNPVWLQNGNQIGFGWNSGTSDGYENIYVMRPDGQEITKLTDSLGFAFFTPAWSPDGKTIVFQRDDLNSCPLQGCPETWIMNSDGTDPRPLPFSDATQTVAYSYTWAPDSQSLAYSSFNSASGTNMIYVLNLSTGIIEVITEGQSLTWQPVSNVESISSLSGRVVDCNSESPLSDVEISYGAEHSVITNENGHYTITNLDSDVYTITPSKEGYVFSPIQYEIEVPQETGLDFTGQSDVCISHIEVTQVIQDKNNEVPLIAGKPTFVRVYVDCSPDCNEAQRITGSLEVSGSAGSITLSPINTEPIGLTHVNHWTDQRDDLDKTLNFIIKHPNLITGTLNITAIVDEARYSEEHIFKPANPLRIAWIPIAYQPPLPPPAPGDKPPMIYLPSEIPNISFLLKVFPLTINDIEFFQQPTSHYPVKMRPSFQEPWQDEYITFLNLFWEYTTRQGGWKGGHTPDRLYGVIPEEAWPGLQIAATGTSDPLWDTEDTSRKGRVAVGISIDREIDGRKLDSSEIMAHELGHLLNGTGLLHASGCIKIEPDNPYRYPDGSIGQWGIDPSKGMDALLSPENYLDFMSATWCGDLWVSDEHYKQLAMGFAPLDEKEDSIELSEPQRQLLVSVTINKSDLTAGFNTSYPIISDIPPDLSTGTDYCFDLRNSNEDTLDNRCFNLSFISPETGQAIEARSLTLVIPYPDDTQSVVLTYRDTELERMVASDNAPIVQLKTPNDSIVVGATETLTVTWSANDLDSDPLRFVVSYSPDNGASWLPLALDIDTTYLTVDSINLPGSNNALFKVEATDNMHMSSDVSDAPMIVDNKNPEPFIITPEKDSIILLGVPLLLQGYAYDLEDGSLDGSVLNWISDLEGDLGNGREILVSLSPGQHLITLTATDNDNNTATETVNITVDTASKNAQPTIEPEAIASDVVSEESSTTDVTATVETPTLDVPQQVQTINWFLIIVSILVGIGAITGGGALVWRWATYSAPANNISICLHCGTPNPAGSHFCSKCGQGLRNE